MATLTRRAFGWPRRAVLVAVGATLTSFLTPLDLAPPVHAAAPATVHADAAHATVRSEDRAAATGTPVGPGWYVQGESHLSLGGVACPTVSTCFAVDRGGAGTVEVTTDGGATWTEQPLPPGVEKGMDSTVSCPDAQHCWLIGTMVDIGTQAGAGVVVATSNGGQTWTVGPAPAAGGLTSSGLIACPSDTTCYLDGAYLGGTEESGADYALYKTTDGGATWAVTSGDGEIGFPDLQCPSTSTCVARTSYTNGFGTSVVYTNDGAQTWQTLDLPPDTFQLPALDDTGLSCPTSTLCYLVGAQPSQPDAQGGPPAVAVVNLTSGSVTVKTGMLPASATVVDIACTGPSSCVAVGQNPGPQDSTPPGDAGVAARTTDGGVTWTQSTPSSVTPSAVSCSASTCVTVGTPGYTPQGAPPTDIEIASSSDSGVSWSPRRATLPPSLSGGVPGLTCPTLTHCLLTGVGSEPHVYASADGGSTWQPTASVPNAQDGWQFTDSSQPFCPPGGSTCVVPGIYESPNHATYRDGSQYTTDYGASWHPVAMPGQDELANSSADVDSCPTATTCYALASGDVVKSVDGGHSFALVYPGGGIYQVDVLSCATALVCITLGDPNFFTGVAEDEATQDGGSTWQPVTVPPDPNGNTQSISALACQPTTTGTVCWAQAASQLLMTTDLGRHWSVQTVPEESGEPAHFAWLTCVSATSCWGGGNSDVFHTSDGSNWTANSLPDQYATPTSLTCPTATACRVIANYGTAILATGNGGIDAPPTAPSKLTLVADHAGNLTVDWPAPTSTGNEPVSTYYVSVVPATDPDPSDITYNHYLTVPGSQTSTTISGLSGGVQYTASVTAVGGVGVSPQVSATITPSTPPGPPQGVYATPGNGSASVSWSAPMLDGGSAITGYTVKMAPGGATAHVGAGATSATVTGLVNGTAYTASVAAVNGYGTGSSATYSVTPAATAPGEPTLTDVSPGNGTLTATWTAPADNGGAPLTGYTVTATNGAQTGTVTVTGTATSGTVTGLTNGDAYSVYVYATNAVGDGPSTSWPSSVAPSPSPPSPPTGVTASAGNASATVSWTAPASNGGSRISGYTVTASPGAATASTTGLSTTVTGLTNGTAYTFTVMAVNAYGNSTPSASSHAVTPTAVSTATALSADPTTATVGQSVTLTAIVAPAGAGGTVTFTSGGATLGHATVSAGTASLATKALPLGTDSVTAGYGGDATHGASTSAAITVTVQQAATTTKLTFTPASPTQGQDVTFTAHMSPGAATGTVTFSDGGTTLGSANLSNGTAVWSTSTLSVGYHGLAASYGGDATYGSSVSDVAAVTVAAAQPGPAPGTFAALAPVRLLDTRASGAVGAHGTVRLQVTGRGGVPAGVSAVVLNVTVTAPSSGGFITVYADGRARPTASNLNFVTRQTVPNLVVAPVGVGGIVDLYNGSAGSVHLIADVSGYYLGGTPTVPGAFAALAPVRLLDTRASGAVGAHGTVRLQVTGRGGVPAGVSAVVLNVTVTAPSSGGFITVYADGRARPTASNLNFVTRQTVPNLVVAPVGAGGIVDLYNGSAGSVHLIADVSGYYLGGTPTVPGAFAALAPVRLLDTRASGAVGAHGTVRLQVTGRGGVPAGVSAVVLNVTVTAPSSGGFITVYADGRARPTASNLNFVTRQTVPNLVVAPVGAGGIVDLYNGSAGSVHLIADVSGYYLGGTSP